MLLISKLPWSHDFRFLVLCCRNHHVITFPQVLATRILHLLGREGPRTQQPSKYIRYIYNRVILESAPVRAAAVTALAKFGAHCEELLLSVVVLLQRCCMDTDDEVRDRATLYMTILQLRQTALNSHYILNGM